MVQWETEREESYSWRVKGHGTGKSLREQAWMHIPSCQPSKESKCTKLETRKLIAHMHAFRVPLCLCYSSTSLTPPTLDKPEYLSAPFLILHFFFQFSYTLPLCTFFSSLGQRNFVANFTPNQTTIHSALVTEHFQ